MTEPTPPNRRQWLAAGAVGAAGVGTGLGVWAWSQRNPPPAAGGIERELQSFWDTHWQLADGQTLASARLRGKPLVINFWATWCAPCLEEMPLLESFFQQNRANGWQILALAADKDSAVQAFMQRAPLSFPVAVAGAAALDWSKRLGNQLGGLPYTVVLGADGKVAQIKAGQLHDTDLARWRELR